MKSPIFQPRTCVRRLLPCPKKVPFFRQTCVRRVLPCPEKSNFSVRPVLPCPERSHFQSENCVRLKSGHNHCLPRSQFSKSFKYCAWLLLDFKGFSKPWKGLSKLHFFKHSQGLETMCWHVHFPVSVHYSFIQ